VDAEQIILEVEDNGIGFDVPNRWIRMAREGHLGLVGASERAQSIGGKLHIQSKPGEGTLVKVTVQRIEE
jgi:signal transduction histidine kinase